MSKYYTLTKEQWDGYMNEHFSWKYYKDEKTRMAIDKELTEIASINARIGMDTPKDERDLRKGEIRFVMEKIKKLDEDLYKRLNPEKDDIL
jgi:hypothetical protein